MYLQIYLIGIHLISRFSDKTKNPNLFRLGFNKERRRHTLPQIAVPSAQAGLTSLFGMGRGEPRRNNHLKAICLKLTAVSL